MFRFICCLVGVLGCCLLLWLVALRGYLGLLLFDLGVGVGGLWFSALLLCGLGMWIGLGWLCFVVDDYFFSF